MLQVNWDKEIEEEEQARRRRKESKLGTPQLGRTSTSSPSGHGLSSEVPAPLPKPKSSASPKPSRTVGNNSASPISATSNSASAGTLDLLGLGTHLFNSSLRTLLNYFQWEILLKFPTSSYKSWNF